LTRLTEHTTTALHKLKPWIKNFRDKCNSEINLKTIQSNCKHMVHYTKGLGYIAIIAQRLGSTERAHH